MAKLLRPLPIRTDGSNAFASHTMRVRVPAILDDVLTANPDFPQQIRDSICALRDGMLANEPVPVLEPPAPDYDEWSAAHAARDGHTWLNTDWFWAETFTYRLLMEAVRWWEFGRDPFIPHKRDEMANEELWHLLEETLSLREKPPAARLPALLRAALWGNRIDLSYMVSAAHGRAGDEDDLLVDDGAAAVAHLLAAPGSVHVVADNAGTELAMDLALIDTLLEGIATRVILHLKMHPTYVSDAIPHDVLVFLDRLDTRRTTRSLADRLRAHLESGRLRLAPDLFWNSSQPQWAAPPRLAAAFQDARLVIFKGDANYRRLVGDALWPEETPFAAVTGYFPAPLAALRTMKSDAVVGLPDGLADRLDAGVDRDTWRNTGRHGLIQFRATGDSGGW